MKKIGKIILIILLVGLVVAGISSLVKASPNTQPTPAQNTYSIQITQNDCLVKVLDAENNPVSSLVQNEEYTITATLADGYTINTITLNEQPITLPHTFTATEDIAIFAKTNNPQPAITTNGFNMSLSLENCTLVFYDQTLRTTSTNLETRTLERDASRYFVAVQPYDGYVVEELIINGNQCNSPCLLKTTSDVEIYAKAVLLENATERNHSVTINVTIDENNQCGGITTNVPSIVILNKDNPSVTYNARCGYANYGISAPFWYQYLGPVEITYDINARTLTFAITENALLIKDVSLNYEMAAVAYLLPSPPQLVG